MIPARAVRVRIAPSPTGYFHIGTARTALFNWLFAKQNKGQFILRIEDTDRERYNVEYEKDIINSLKWLGLTWDEGPYQQSKRSAIYKRYIKTLLQKKILYHCFCTKEELETERQAQLAQGIPPKYSGKCRRLKTSETKKRLGQKESSVLRLAIPDVKISFKDMIRGEVSFDAGLMGDLVIAKNEQTPLYNLAAVIDDEEMKISHVIRGEDHLANTPKQIILQRVLGFNQPKYAHLPLILDPDRSKLSKRYAAAAIQEYQEKGYLSAALVNFLLLLGWHPQDNQEIFSKEEMIDKFELQRVQKGSAVFNADKLNWINAQYVKKLTDKELAKLLKIKANSKNMKIIALLKERMVKLGDFKELSDFFYNLLDYPAELLPWEDISQTDTRKYLEEIYKMGRNIDEIKIRSLAEQAGSRGAVLWPLRIALSGKRASPGPFEIINILGKKESLKRIKIALDKLG